MKIITVIGARPQFIKAATVSRRIKEHVDISEIIVHTGQHFDQNMSQVFFDELSIPAPHYNLNINSLNHGAMTGKMLASIEEVLLKEKPDCLLVYGDTNSTLAGALAAKKLKIKVAHIEAGLRSYNMDMPEEINRILTDRMSDFLFCPTQAAETNLIQEGFDHFNATIEVSGDVMYDAALFYSAISDKKSRILSVIDSDDYVLCTIHRAENTDNPDKLISIFQALNTINEEKKVILPLHPRTQQLLARHGIHHNLTTIDPVGYLDMIQLIKNSKLVLTDSGGLQKEAYFFLKYCITLREETEWVELVKNSFNLLAGSNTEKILNAYSAMKEQAEMTTINLYGDGNASGKIVSSMQNCMTD